jgi:hypothetical protein
MAKSNAAEEDWDVLRSFFPVNWRELARSTRALKGLRQDKSEEDFLRVLLMHLGCGLSLRDTVVRAQQAQLADLSDVGLLKRLRKGQGWLYELCRGLFEQCDFKLKAMTTRSLRLIDATDIKEPGKTGSLWRIHYSVCWPTWRCDFFKLTATEGAGTGETLRQFPLKAGDYVLADGGYSHASGLHYARSQKALVTVRLNPDGLVLWDQSGQPFALPAKLKPIQKTGQVAVWQLRIPYLDEAPLTARLCVVRKTKAAIALAHKRLRRRAQKSGWQLQPQTLIYAEYVMVLTTFPEREFPAALVLEYYRFRWQVELVFKRFKQIAQLGHLPKHDPESSKAWLYGKLFVALLTEKMIQQARALSPWGYELPAAA